jgi:hypothetical protein
VTVVIDPRFNGPPGSANGGYTSGLVAELVDGEAEVTLRRPPPLGRPLRVERADGAVCLLDGDALVAEGLPASVELEPAAPVTVEEATRAAEAYPGFDHHVFPTCLVCGPERPEGEGLRIFAGPVEGRDVVAAPWAVPAWVDRRIVWAALDCPGAIAVGFPERGDTVLGRLAARIDRVPEPGATCVVVAWPLGEEGRKLYAGTALYDEAGYLLALARATWIVPLPSGGA